MRRRTARVTATSIGIAAVCVIALALTFWQDMLVGYHLYSLRNDPGYLREIAAAPENSPKRLALTKYLETQDGKQHLFEIYLEVNEVFISRLADLPEYPKRGVLGINFDGRVVFYVRPDRGRNMVLEIGGTNESIAPLLPLLVGGSYVSENSGNLRFSFQDPQSATSEVGMEGFDSPEGAIGVIIRRTTALPGSRTRSHRWRLR